MGTFTKARKEMSGTHFQTPVPVAVAPSEAEETDVENTSPELVIMAPHSNVFDDRTNTNDILDWVISMDTTKETLTENPVSGQGSQVGWTIYSGDTEPLPVPMIPPDSSWVSPKMISGSTFTQVRTSKPYVSPLGPSKQKPLSRDRESPTPFPRQDGVSDKVTPPLGVNSR